MPFHDSGDGTFDTNSPNGPIWYDATLENGFANLDSTGVTFDKAGYCLLNGWVCIRGMISGGASRADGVTIFTLPAGFRIGGPSNFKTHTIMAAGNTPVGVGTPRVNIYALDGRIVCNNLPATDWFSLSFISYPAGA